MANSSAPSTKPSLRRLLIQAQLNKFYSHPVAQVSLGLVLTIVAIVFFALVAIRPTLNTMAELIKQIEDKKQMDQKLSLKITALSTAQAELATKQTDALVLDRAVPSTPLFSHFLKQIEKTCSQNQVTIISLTTQAVPIERDPQTIQGGTNLESIPITLSVRGTYSQLLLVLRQISGLQRLVVIDRVDIFPTTDGDENTLNMSLSLRAFVFSATPAPKAVKSAPPSKELP